MLVEETTTVSGVYAQEHTPRHLLALVILGNIIRSKNARKKLKKGRIDSENGKEESKGYSDAEGVSKGRLGRGHADEETAERVRDEQAEYQL